MKLFRIILLGILIIFSSSISYSRARYNGIAQKGAKVVQTSPSTSFKLMETFPSCTITVYLAGTTTLVSIYSDSAGTPKANPFTANSDASYSFYADNGKYDIKFSGTGITSPFTISDILISDPTESYDPKSFGAKCDNSTNDFTAFNTILTLVSTTNSTIVIPKLGPCRLNTISFPANVTLDFSSSGGVYANTSNTVTILGSIISPIGRKIFYNATAGLGTVTLVNNKVVGILTPDMWGVAPSVDTSPAIISAIASAPTSGATIKFLEGNTYLVTHRIALKSNLNIIGYGAIIDATGIAITDDTFYIAGHNSSGSEMHDIYISGLKMINNLNRYSIDIYGLGFTFPPYNIHIKDNNFSGNTNAGPIYINVGHHVWITHNINIGGKVFIGSESPVTAIASPFTLHHIWVENNSTTQHTQNGYQFVYGEFIWLSHNYAEGSLMVTPEVANFVIDRCKKVKVDNNISENAGNTLHHGTQFIITGSDDVNISNNTMSGVFSTGINAIYNIEFALDATINENHRIIVNGNNISSYDPAANAINFNGVQSSVISNNTMPAVGAPNVNILIQDSVRGDGTPEFSTNNTVTGNVGGGAGQFSSVAHTNVCGNYFASYTGSSFACILANGSTGGIDLTNGSSIARDSGTGLTNIIGSAVKVTNSIQLSNNVAFSRGGVISATLSPIAVGANTCAAQSVTVTGVVVGDVLNVIKPTEQAGLGNPTARVTGTNTVSLNFCNNTGAPITPTASEIYKFSIVQ